MAGAAFCQGDAAFCQGGPAICSDDAAFCSGDAAFCSGGEAFCSDGEAYCSGGEAFCPDGEAFCSDDTAFYSDDAAFCPEGAAKDVVRLSALPRQDSFPSFPQLYFVGFRNSVKWVFLIHHLPHLLLVFRWQGLKPGFGLPDLIRFFAVIAGQLL